MEPEQQQEQRYRNNQNGKKPKQKKIPQRGLGVAQLEKMRLEEEHQKIKKDDPSSQSHPFSLMPPPPQTTFTHLPLPPQSSGHGLLPSVPFRSPSSNDFNFNPLSSSSHVMLQRQRQPPPVCSSMVVNISSSAPLSSSGVANNLQIEPPSNQSYSSNNYFHRWSEKEKMVGMKRRWPFPPHKPHGSSFPIEDEPTFGHSEVPYTSNAVQIDWIGSLDQNPNKKFKENGVPPAAAEPLPAAAEPLLTLGPTTPSNSQSKQQQTTFPATLYCEFPEIHFHRSQEIMEGAFFRPGGGSEQRQPFYDFLPPGPIRPAVASDDRRNEAIDGDNLNLKL